jgi:PRTRC genetic system ParB family protein
MYKESLHDNHSTDGYISEDINDGDDVAILVEEPPTATPPPTKSDVATDGQAKEAVRSLPTVSIPMAKIVLDFQNTRRRLNQDEIDSLKASIKELGLLSAITVKKRCDGGYTLLAGFKRYEAMSQLGAENINAIMMDENTSEATMTEANIAENLIRSGLSLGESCSAIKRLLTVLEGDEEHKIEQISVRLSLTKKQITDRIILTNLFVDGLNAFDDGKISLKTAIVLAGCTEVQQKDFLSKLVKKQLTHEGLLAAIGKATAPLKLAKFDKTECQSCPSNSELQGSLFVDDADSQGDAKCQNIECFKKKSKDWFDGKKAEYEKEFGTVILVTQTDRSEINVISAKTLGDEQLSDCATCSNNVNLMQNKLTEQFGNITHEICNNKTCFSECATKYKASTAEAATENEKTPNKSSSKVEKTTQSTDVKTEKPAETNATLSRLGREALYTALANEQLKKGLSDPKDKMMLLALGLLNASSHTGNSLNKMVSMKDLSIEELLDEVSTVMGEFLQGAVKETGEGSMDRKKSNILIGLLKGKGELDKDIINSWTPDMLKHHTKGAIKQILMEAKFDTYLDEKQGKGAFSKLMGEKVDSLHKGIKDSGFDFTDFAPSVYIKHAKKVASSIN